MIAEQFMNITNTDNIRIFLKTTLLLFMKKSLKVNTTREVRQQFTNFINISHLLLVKPSDLMNDTPVFPSSYKMK